MTQEDLAEKIDVSRQTISKWEMDVAFAKVIGWDFSFPSQDQINVFHMHGYSSACIAFELEE